MRPLLKNQGWEAHQGPDIPPIHGLSASSRFDPRQTSGFQQGRWALAHVVGKKQDWDDFLLFLIHHSARMANILFLDSWPVKASRPGYKSPQCSSPFLDHRPLTPVLSEAAGPILLLGPLPSLFTFHHPVHSSEPWFAHLISCYWLKIEFLFKVSALPR